MQIQSQKIVPCLWFDSQAEEAAEFYVSIFPDAKLGKTARYGEAGREIHGREPGSVMTIEFQLAGQSFTALNGGPIFKFNEAISLQVMCDTQAEIDDYWEQLSAGGDPQAQQCGWLKDRFGLSWQIVPQGMYEMMSGDPQKVQRVFTVMLQMKKLDLEQLRKAYEAT